ncbi:hypothetical protein Ahy_A09g043081 [Arachis hypogaea]|uniref:Uncharacterized protein n=1 Tax=Arachis hypogaea TaxID=3818 RepID=A0A445BHH5_ARAHY|nr:hypothetical protein Ahy_A09g043081 [Arachis hypogaea]
MTSLYWSQEIRDLMILYFVEELTAILHGTYDNMMAEMQEYKAKNKEKYLLPHKAAFLDDIDNLQNPPRMRTIGCPKNGLGSNIKK